MAALALPSGAHAGCGGTMLKAHTKRVGHHRAPLVIGDSVLLGAMPQVAARGWDVDAHGCRQISEGLAVLRAHRRAHTLPFVVALQLGTDGTISNAQLRSALNLMGPNRLLVLLTPREVGPQDDAPLIRRFGAAHPRNVLVLDWAQKTKGHPAWFQPDGIHLMPGGADALARILQPALRYADGPIARITHGRLGKVVLSASR